MYLKNEEIITLLRLGKPVEQWLGSDSQPDYVVLKWVRIDKEKNGAYAVTYFEMFDDGNENFLDIYEFELVNPDDPYGVISEFSSYEEALEFCVSKYHCVVDRFIGGGMIQEEYRQYLASSSRL